MPTIDPYVDGPDLTEAELAEAVGVNPRTIARYRNQPDGLPHYYLGGRVKIRRKDWRQFIERRIIRPNPTRETPAAQ